MGGVFGDANWLHENIDQTFANGTFVGTTINFIGTVGLKAGPVVTPSFLPSPVWLYGIVGPSVMNETLKIDIGGPLSASNQSIPGLAVGLGFELKPIASYPVTVFGEYRHMFWEGADFRMPATSASFNYNYGAWNNRVMVGVDYNFGSH